MWFNTHADVHPPHRQPDPWNCIEKDGRFYGRGVADTKGQLAALAAALESTDAPAEVVITSGEETDGYGSRFLALSEVPQDGGIVLEPTDFAVCTSQAGCIDFELDVTGTPAHMAAPEAAHDALERLRRSLRQMTELEFMKTTHPLLPNPRLHIGVLEVGEHLWRIPGRARALGSLGLLPGTDSAKAAQEMRESISEIQILDVNEGIEVPKDLPVIQRLKSALGRDFRIGGMPSWTDAANLQIEHGIACVIFGAGDLSVAHSDNESVKVSDLDRLYEVFCRLLDSANASS